MLRVLLTGASGQVGSRVVRKLLRSGYDVLAFVLPGDENFGRLDGLDLEICRGNLLDPDSVEKAVSQVDAVVHTANLVSPLPGMTQSEFFDNNVRSTLHLAWSAGRRAESIERFVHISSSSVYPNDSHQLRPAYHPVDEEHPKRPRGTYALSKLIGEKILESVRDETGLRTVVLRPSGIVSGDAVLQRFTVGLAAAILKAGYKNPESEVCIDTPVEPWKDLEEKSLGPEQPIDARDTEGHPWVYQLVDARDVAEAAVLALERPEAVGEVFNVACESPIPFSDSAPLISEVTGLPILKWEFPVRWVFDLSIEKARSVLAYRPKWGIEQMVRSASAFRRAEADGYEEPFD